MEKKSVYSSLNIDTLYNKKVIIHPLVLLSVVDHYNRSSQGSNRRVVGTLLGELSTDSDEIHITNSYAVPFEEDKNVWFFNHIYHENLCRMFKKVNAKEHVLGWYGTGSAMTASDLDVHEFYRKYVPHPVYILIDPQSDGITPVQAYFSFEEATSDEKFRRAFRHAPAIIGAHEPEEVGVEHLLRELKNASTSTLATKVCDKLSALTALIHHLRTMASYLSDVAEGKLPQNCKILYNMQDILNLLPDLARDEIVRAFAVETNDALLALYLGSVIRSVHALHELINNKIQNKKAHAKKIEEITDEKKDDTKDKKDEKKDVKDEKKDVKDGKKDVKDEKKDVKDEKKDVKDEKKDEKI